MMVKINAKVVLDANSPKGRMIGIRVETDDDFLNQTIGLPSVIQKTYPINATANQIRIDMKQTIKDLIRSVNRRLKDESLLGKEMEINI